MATQTSTIYIYRPYHCRLSELACVLPGGTVDVNANARDSHFSGFIAPYSSDAITARGRSLGFRG